MVYISAVQTKWSSNISCMQKDYPYPVLPGKHIQKCRKKLLR